MSPRPFDRDRAGGAPGDDRGVRRCGRPGCNEPADALLAVDGPAAVARLLALPDEPTTLTLVLCRAHADALVVPRGWTLLDERAIGRLFASGGARRDPAAPAAGPAPASAGPGEGTGRPAPPPRRARRAPRPAPAAPPRVVAEPVALPAEHHPLLHRAFRAASAPSRPPGSPEAAS